MVLCFLVLLGGVIELVLDVDVCVIKIVLFGKVFDDCDGQVEQGLFRFVLKDYVVVLLDILDVFCGYFIYFVFDLDNLSLIY